MRFIIVKIIKTISSILVIFLCVIVLLTYLVVTSSKKANAEQFRESSYGAFFVETENSIFGVKDIRYSSFYDIEQDTKGRVMYLFYGNSTIADEDIHDSCRLFGVLIQQKRDMDNVFYYPDMNFLIKQIPVDEYGHYIATNEDELVEFFNGLSDQEINEFKEKNDWDKPINEGKCIKKPIVDNFGKRVPLVKKSIREEVFNNEFANVYPDPKYFFEYLTGDDYDRHIYFGRTVDELKVYTNSYVIMFFPDNSYVVKEINDLWNYQEELRDFKVTNNWDKPIK